MSRDPRICCPLGVRGGTPAVLSSSWPLVNESDSVLLRAGWMAGTLHEPALGHPLSDLALTPPLWASEESLGS